VRRPPRKIYPRRTSAGAFCVWAAWVGLTPIPWKITRRLGVRIPLGPANAPGLQPGQEVQDAMAIPAEATARQACPTSEAFETSPEISEAPQSQGFSRLKPASEPEIFTKFGDVKSRISWTLALRQQLEQM
jgi:hypothetical protein